MPSEPAASAVTFPRETGSSTLTAGRAAGFSPPSGPTGLATGGVWPWAAPLSSFQGRGRSTPTWGPPATGRLGRRLRRSRLRLGLGLRMGLRLGLWLRLWLRLGLGLGRRSWICRRLWGLRIDRGRRPRRWPRRRRLRRLRFGRRGFWRRSRRVFLVPLFLHPVGDRVRPAARPLRFRVRRRILFRCRHGRLRSFFRQQKGRRADGQRPPKPRPRSRRFSRRWRRKVARGDGEPRRPLRPPSSRTRRTAISSRPAPRRFARAEGCGLAGRRRGLPCGGRRGLALLLLDRGEENDGLRLTRQLPLLQRPIDLRRQLKPLLRPLRHHLRADVDQVRRRVRPLAVNAPRLLVLVFEDAFGQRPLRKRRMAGKEEIERAAEGVNVRAVVEAGRSQGLFGRQVIDRAEDPLLRPLRVAVAPPIAPTPCPGSSPLPGCSPADSKA